VIDELERIWKVAVVA